MARGFAVWRMDPSRKRKGWWLSLTVTTVLSIGVVVGVAVKKPKSLRELGDLLASQQVAGEPVLMLGSYYYDLPFYARLSARCALKPRCASRQAVFVHQQLGGRPSKFS